MLYVNKTGLRWFSIVIFPCYNFWEIQLHITDEQVSYPDRKQCIDLFLFIVNYRNKTRGKEITYKRLCFITLVLIYKYLHTAAR